MNDLDKWEATHTDEAEFTVSNGHGDVWNTYRTWYAAQEMADILNSEFNGD